MICFAPPRSLSSLTACLAIDSQLCLYLCCCTHFIIIFTIPRFCCQKARYVLQTSCSQRLPQSYPLLDSPDPSKTHSTVRTHFMHNLFCSGAARVRVAPVHGQQPVIHQFLDLRHRERLPRAPPAGTLCTHAFTFPLHPGSFARAPFARALFVNYITPYICICLP